MHDYAESQEGVLPNARGYELTNFALWMAPGQPLPLPFAHILFHLLKQRHSQKHTVCIRYAHFQLQAATTLVNDSAAMVLYFITPGTLSLMNF